jgi:stage III sporulation protein SpoIIIAA
MQISIILLMMVVVFSAIVGLTYRVGRHIPGVASLVHDLMCKVKRKKGAKSLLLLGPPAVGKTTLLRDVARTLSESLRVMVCDTSNEIAGDGDAPHSCIGDARRIQVAKRSEQYDVLLQAVQNHSPQVLIGKSSYECRLFVFILHALTNIFFYTHMCVVDELGTKQEVAAARTVAQRGVRMVATCHGINLSSLLRDPVLNVLVGGLQTVTISDDLARER